MFLNSPKVKIHILAHVLTFQLSTLSKRTRLFILFSDFIRFSKRESDGFLIR